jgi:uncharacterized repeat protein (TIGR03803 family)
MRPGPFHARSLLAAAVAMLFSAVLLPAKAGAAGPLYRILHDFVGADSGSPNSPLVEATDGFFYGTLGGNADGINHGAIFRMDRSGTVQIVHRFTGPDGDGPTGLIEASDGFFYGTTVRGGTPTNANCTFMGGCGTFFRMDGSGNLTVLHSFNWGTDDGNWPNGGIVEGADGNFYGTTFQGGDGQEYGGFGIAYRIGRSGTYTLLHKFSRPEGINPNGGLIQATDGNLYGVTNQYGPASGGTVFRMDRAGNVTVIHGFGFGDGYQPKARLIQATDSLLYGTTEGGGASGNGVVFRVGLDGSPFQVLHAFDQWGSDGYRPIVGVIEGRDGNFYGTTPTDGLGVYNPDRSGDVFRMTSSGVVSVLHTFYGPDGSSPYAALVEASDGRLLGSTVGGGSAGAGVIFEVDPTAALPVASLSISPNPLTQGETGTGTVTLAQAAPSGGTVVELSTNNEGAAQVPHTVTVAGGRASATFPVTTDYPIFSTASLLVFGSVDGAGISTPLTVKPGNGGSTDVTIESLQVDPSTVKGGGTVTGTVTLTGPAPSGGFSVALSTSRHRIAKVPSSITIPGGATSGSFTVTTRQVSSTVVVTITAKGGGSSKSVKLTVTR